MTLKSKINFKKVFNRNLIAKKIKNKNNNFFVCLLLICSFSFNNYNKIIAADINSVLSLISAPIAGFSLPENFVAQARAYLLAHPDLDYNAIEAKIIGARGVVQAAIAGKEVNSLSDIVKFVSPEQRNAVIADLQAVAKEADVSVAVDNIANISDASGKDIVAAVDKKTGAPIFTTESIIKATGRTPNLSLRFLKTVFFLFLSAIEIIFIIKYKSIKSKKSNKYFS